MLDKLKKIWQVLNRPSVHYSLGFLTLGGFVAGVIFWGALTLRLKPRTEKPFVLVAMKWKITSTKSYSRLSISLTVVGCVQLALTAMCRTTGPIKLPVRCRHRKKSGVKCLVPSIPAKSLRVNVASWLNMNGQG